ncbi:MAG: hypothetical protein HY678_04695 [Chloroflexi bacterium]|nr:hypothetical protein [Chloroflexota bacterium]
MQASQPVKPILLVRPPLGIMYERSFWDELEAVGIKDVAVMWLALLDNKGGQQPTWPRTEDTHPRALAALGGKPVQATAVGAFKPNHPLYKGLSIQPPEMPDRLVDESRRLKASIRDAKRRGFRLYFCNDAGYFTIGNVGGAVRVAPARCMTDPELAAYVAARSRDTIENFPEFEGIMQDGPDFKWEIRPNHRDDMFLEVFDFDEYRRVAREIGLTIERVVDGRDVFKRRLHAITPRAAEDFVQNRGGLFGSLDWWAEEPAVFDWMRFKAAAIEAYLTRLRTALKDAAPSLEVFMSSRMPCLAPLTGHNLRRKQAYTDYQMPKEYWWSGAVAGYRGTATNWIRTLVDWNPGLAHQQAERWFSAAFDVPMPSDYPVTAYEKEASDEWFSTTVRDQTRKMISSAGGPAKFVPWVGLEHFGSNWVTATELQRLLAEIQAQGATRYAWYVYNSIKPDIWRVITDFSRVR